MNEQEIRRRKLALELIKEKRNCKEFAFFVRAAWEVLEPSTPLKWNWHMDVLCEELQKQAYRIAERRPKEYNLIINVPPRSLKSTLASKLLLPYAWTFDPSQRFLTSSYSSALSIEHAVDSRRVIQSAWYQRHWGDMFTLEVDKNVKSNYANTKKGHRFATSVGGSATGFGGDWVMVDDPVSSKEACSDVIRKDANSWWTKTMFTRLNDPEIGIFVIIMQRLHEDDLTGEVLKGVNSNYKLFCFPAEDSEDVAPVQYRKKYVNGLLFPNRLSKEYLESALSNMGQYDYAGQYQQRPSPAEGGMFKRVWWKYWKPAGMDLPAVSVRVGSETYSIPALDLPEQMEDTICSWDLGLKDKEKNDPHSGQTWARLGANYFLLDHSYGKRNALAATEEVAALKRKYNHSSAVLIEDEAAGSIAILSLQNVISGIIGIRPTESKQTRAIPMSRFAEAGNIFLPHPLIAEWVDGYIDEFAAFPNATHDDRVDSATQAVNFFLRNKKVFTEYNPKTMRLPFKIDFSNLAAQSKVVVSAWLEKDMKMSIVMALWHAQQGRLWIFDETVSESHTPESIRAILLTLLNRDSKGVISNPRQLRQIGMYGNSLFFERSSSNLSTAYASVGIPIYQQKEYSENSAIIKTSRLLFRNALIVHSRAGELHQQLIEWSMDKNSPQEKHGLCRAAVQMVHGLFSSGEPAKMKPMKAYSQANTNFLKGVENSMNNGRFDQLVANQFAGKKGTNKRSSTTGDKDWMAL